MHFGFSYVGLVYLVMLMHPCGIPALQNGDLLKPNEAYFSYVDYVLDRAEFYGFYVLLLPAWGELVVGWDWIGGIHRKIVTEDNAYEYGKWLGDRMKHRKNLLWCLGGDRMPVCRGEDYRPVWRSLAEGLAFGLVGKPLRYDRDREEWKKLLITYHACHEAETGLCSTFSYWTEDEAWISFIMLQSGHGAFKKNYDLIREEREREIHYPVWDGEPAYEMMPMTWPVEDEDSFHGTYIVRKRAYWALLAGAFGHTYGHASVWCTATWKDKNQICRVTWDEAIHSEGSAQMKILRNFMESFALHEFVPCQERLLCQSSRKDELDIHEQAAVNMGRKQMLVYFSAATSERIDIRGVLDGEVSGGWFNPSTGELKIITGTMDINNGILSVKNDSADGRDRILILSADSGDVLVERRLYAGQTEKENIKKVFEW